MFGLGTKEDAETFQPLMGNGNRAAMNLRIPVDEIFQPLMGNGNRWFAGRSSSTTHTSNPSWGTGTFYDRAGYQWQPVASNPSWGTGTIGYARLDQQIGCLPTPHGEREPVYVPVLLPWTMIFQPLMGVSVHACGGIFGSIRSVGLRCS